MILFFFHSENIKKVIEAFKSNKKEVSASFDLNLSQQVWPIENNKLILSYGSCRDRNSRIRQDLCMDDLCIDIDTLKPLASSTNKIFFLKDKEFLPLEIRSKSYYKLVPTDTVPILEIDGIKMHRTKDITPLEDAENKTRKIIAAGDRVLDTCSGLGYTAVFAMKAGANELISTDKSPEVIKLRNLNPWLSHLSENFSKKHGRQPEFINADIGQYIEQLEDNYFNSVIHDPPRFTSQTGDLYGKDFYGSLFRVMKKGGKLFHYTGSPKKITSQDRFIKNTMKRLEGAGFSKLSFDDRLQGIFGYRG